MLKKKLGGGLLLSYDKVKKREMDAKSGSVLPTIPRTKGIASCAERAIYAAERRTIVVLELAGS